MLPKIGILGGIGPEASAEFYKKLIQKCQNSKIKNNQSYPYIILESIPAPELFLKKPNLKMYEDGIKNLEKCKSNFIVIICNTAHIFFKHFQALVKIPIINLEGEIEKVLKKQKIKSIFILGSSATANNLFRFKNIETNSPTKVEQNKIDNIIKNYNAGKSKKLQKKDLLKIVNKYKKHTLLLACTEISAMLKDENLKYIDTMDVALEVTYTKWKK
ncbi:aspartate/glutamate racemase family protein [Candidatus Nomurabacteria bacterium]|nr:aspartate/glutamate racemase family protein [Candidatus Nomurabacteria bacterium]